MKKLPKIGQRVCDCISLNKKGQVIAHSRQGGECVIVEWDSEISLLKL